MNSGSLNSGDWNSGIFNSCDFSSGIFNTKEEYITIFNQKSNMTMKEFINSIYYDAIKSEPFTLTKWIDYTDEEKEENVIRNSIGGYLKKYTYKEACKNWWNRLTHENKKIIMSIPNFDKNVFKEITGIDVGK